MARPGKRPTERPGAWRAPKPLGIGLPYIMGLDPALYHPGMIDFVELTPETICRPTGPGPEAPIAPVPEQLAEARAICGALPMVVHGVELSIGSARGWNPAYLSMLDALHAVWPFAWHSEHLHFQTMRDTDGSLVETGVPLPLPLTEEAVAVVAGRARVLGQRYDVPFLLENAAHYLPALPRDPAIADEAAFMNRITQSGACGQLLDLHNVHCNAVNHGFDPVAFLDRLHLDRVAEIHVAGGSWQDGVWVDAHDGRVPEPVWALLDHALPRCPNLAGIVFEVLDEYAPQLGAALIAEEVGRARAAWQRNGGPG